MAELIPTYNMSDFKKLKANEIKQLKTCELTADGEYLCTVVIPQTSYIRIQTEYLGQLGNAVSGKNLEDIVEEVKV